MKNFIDKSFFGSILMAVTIWGIPFIPFVPIIVLFGGFKTIGTIWDGFTSVVFTFVLGIFTYTSIIFWVIVK